MSSSADPIATAAAIIGTASHITVLTGAGVSAESGIPTFRDALTGLWENYNPEQLATPQAFADNPELVTRWYDERRLNVAACKPNPAHQALVTIEQSTRARGATFTLITQNVDRLHQRAGSTGVLELHGSLFTWRCTRTGNESEFTGPAFDRYPPVSPAGGLWRPGVVWFGEMLDDAIAAAAHKAAESCDVFLTVGTSAIVYPAAGLLPVAHANGAATIEINRDSTPASDRVDIAIHALAGSALPRIAEAVSAQA